MWAVDGIMSQLIIFVAPYIDPGRNSGVGLGRSDEWVIGEFIEVAPFKLLI